MFFVTATTPRTSFVFAKIVVSSKRRGLPVNDYYYYVLSFPTGYTTYMQHFVPHETQSNVVYTSAIQFFTKTGGDPIFFIKNMFKIVMVVKNGKSIPSCGHYSASARPIAGFCAA